MTPPSTAALLHTARQAAARQAWGDVRAAIADARAAVDQVPELAVLLAEAEYRSSNPAAAEEIARGVEQAPGAAASASLRSRAANVVGASAFTQGRLSDAADAFERALERGRLAGDQLVVARALNNLGNVLGLRGESEAALSHYRRAIPLYEQVGVTRGVAECYHNMAIVARDHEQWADAEELEHRAATYARLAGDARLLAMSQTGRADALLRRGVAEAAAALAERAALALERLGDMTMEADARCVMGRALTALGRLASADEALQHAARLSAEGSDALISAEVLEAMAMLASRRGEATRALEMAARSFALFRSIGTPHAMRRASALLVTLERMPRE
jgi:tetratricopeptide (TPR) repeat protein